MYFRGNRKRKFDGNKKENLHGKSKKFDDKTTQKEHGEKINKKYCMNMLLILKVVQDEIRATRRCRVEMAWSGKTVVIKQCGSTNTMMKSTTRSEAGLVAAEVEERRRSRRRMRQQQKNTKSMVDVDSCASV